MDPVIFIFLLAFILPGGISFIAQIPEDTWKLMLHPRHLKMELKARKQLRAIEASQRHVAQLEIEHKESLKEVQVARNAELDYFDYQLFELERPIMLRELTEKATEVVNRQLPEKDALAVLTELNEAYHKTVKFKEIEPSVEGTVEVIQKLAREVENHRSMLVDIERFKIQADLKKKKELEVKKWQEANAPVPYIPEARHILDLLEIINDPHVSVPVTIAAMRKFLGDEWDDVAFYYDDDVTITRIAELVEAKVARGFARENWTSEVQAVMEKRIMTVDDPEEYLKIIGVK